MSHVLERPEAVHHREVKDLYSDKSRLRGDIRSKETDYFKYCEGSKVVYEKRVAGNVYGGHNISPKRPGYQGEMGTGYHI